MILRILLKFHKPSITLLSPLDLNNKHIYIYTDGHLVLFHYCDKVFLVNEIKTKLYLFQLLLIFLFSFFLQKHFGGGAPKNVLTKI